MSDQLKKQREKFIKECTNDFGKQGVRILSKTVHEMWAWIEKQYHSPSPDNTARTAEEILEAYKECFELFIPTEKRDDATAFLSTYGSGLAKDLLNKNR